YRSTDGGGQWQEITAGLPSQFGFPMAAHPRDPQTVWTVPLNGDDKGRYVPDGSAAVWRTHDGGDSWIRAGDGLPQRDAYVGVLREAMAIDRLDPVGVYFGTSTGQLYGSTDEGESWRLIADQLPSIWSVEAMVLDR
ncbi:MAG: exo-alpha-sialidase, partial [Chloroflexota bacterium]|nr:exo-alpha-sialidase [Chloroflexota bacterium]